MDVCVGACLSISSQTLLLVKYRDGDAEVVSPECHFQLSVPSLRSKLLADSSVSRSRFPLDSLQSTPRVDVEEPFPHPLLVNERELEVDTEELLVREGVEYDISNEELGEIASEI